MPKYNHAFDIAFEVVSEKEDGSDVTADMMRAALEKRIASLDSHGDLYWEEAVGAPYDTYREDDESASAKLRKLYGVNENLKTRKELAREREIADHEQELYDEGRLLDI